MKSIKINFGKCTTVDGYGFNHASNVPQLASKEDIRIYKMSESTPICRCRVLYLGSSVPQQTKDGLQGIQEPLQELYPDQGGNGAKGIDSWLSVWSNGILLENVDENHKAITRFFPIESLHYCAAVSKSSENTKFQRY
ncbi:hypothetical protein WA026_012625 [Henosepilachna vigintioctopunctata]|uniref:Uncharacterized protein n=1 Tax=Henosepilachna vigintioctopunctata TaxID=420089 RepID=A0AAW1U1D5_9CUCU